MNRAVDVFQGQGWLQLGELALAFVLSALVGLERQLRGKSAGLRTQAIVGTSGALLLLVSKYGFTEVLGPHVSLDPSRVAAQIVSCGVRDDACRLIDALSDIDGVSSVQLVSEDDLE